MLTIACVKSKPNYGPEYVNALYRAVQRHLTVPHLFVCFTDDADGVECMTIPLAKGLRGWWGKLALFRHVRLETMIFFDLDTIIVDNIDFMVPYAGRFAILRDFYRDDGYGSGVMMWNGDHRKIWETWVLSGCPNHPLGDQGWMEHMLGPNADRLQDLFKDKIVSYKVHCEHGLPKDAAIVCFHGVPKPHYFPEHHWVRRSWDTGEP